MKKPPKVIDPSDGLHAAVDRVLAGLSPQERARRLMEMFPDKKEEGEYPENYDQAEQLAKEIARFNPPEGDEEGAIKAEAIRRARVRKMVSDAERRSRGLPTGPSVAPQLRDQSSSE